MAQTSINSDGLAAGSITRSKLNTTLAGNAVIAKVIQGTGISIANTGVDAGTGDVTISGTGPQKWAGDIGDGATNPITVTHNLNTLDICMGFYLNATGVEVTPDVTGRTTNSVTLNFGAVPTAAQYRLVVTG